jgi:hypothetical protein
MRFPTVRGKEWQAFFLLFWFCIIFPTACDPPDYLHQLDTQSQTREYDRRIPASPNFIRREEVVSPPSPILFASTNPELTSNSSQLPDIGYAPNPIWRSVGYRLGFLLNMRYQWDQLVVWAYEAQMILGFGTSTGPIVELNCYTAAINQAQDTTDQAEKNLAVKTAADECYLFANPIRLSTYDGKYYEIFNNLKKDQPVVVYFAIPTVTIAGLFTKSKDWIYGIYTINPDQESPHSYRVPYSYIPIASLINPEEGTIQGRVVQLSVEHPIRKTYEAIIQEQENDNSFTAMSVNDPKMFNFIKQAMLTGKYLQIKYVRLFTPEGWLISAVWPYNTYFRIIEVTIL